MFWPFSRKKATEDKKRKARQTTDDALAGSLGDAASDIGEFFGDHGSAGSSDGGSSDSGGSDGGDGGSD